MCSVHCWEHIGFHRILDLAHPIAYVAGPYLLLSVYAVPWGWLHRRSFSFPLKNCSTQHVVAAQLQYK